MTPCSNVRAGRDHRSHRPTCAYCGCDRLPGGDAKQARKKVARFPHVVVEQADITDLHYADDSFDAVVAGNVIHLLPESGRDALKEIKRSGARAVDHRAHLRDSRNGAHTMFLRLISLIRCALPGALLIRPVPAFFERMGCTGVTHRVVRGRIPCVIASFTNDQ